MGIFPSKIGTQSQATIIEPNKNLIIIGCYTLLTLILTYPVAFRLTSHIAGFAGEDNLQWRWFLWWFKHSILTLQTSVADVSVLFAPLDGEQPLYLITSYLPALSLPVTLIAGPTLSFNLNFLLAFILSAYTAYLLGYYLTKNRWAAFITGLIFGFYPARFGYGTGTFLGQMTTYFLPLYVLALFMMTQRPTKRRTIWGAIVLACLCLTWPLHVAYGVVIITIPFFAVQIWVWLRQPDRRSNIKYVAMMFGLTFLLVISLYVPLMSAFLQGKGKFGARTVAIDFSADLLAFISPSNYHPILTALNLLPDYATRVLADNNDIQERLAYIGIISTFLVIIGTIKFWPQTRFWLVTAFTSMILSLGPLLKFNGGPPLQVNIEGYVGYIVLPYVLIASFPVIKWSGVLGRLNVTTMLCVAVMATYGLSYLISKLRIRWKIVVLSGLSLLILLEYLTIFPFPMEPDIVPDYYTQLQKEADTKPQKIVDFPLLGDPAYNNYAMHYQTIHQQPMAGGHFMRKPGGSREMAFFINALLSPPVEQNVIATPDSGERLGLLNKFGFSKIVARMALIPNDNIAHDQLDYVSSWLETPHLNGDVTIFEIPAGGTSSSSIVTIPAPEWQPSIINPNHLQLQTPADIFIYHNAENNTHVVLQISLSAPTSERYLTIDLDGEQLIRLYLAQDVLHYNIPFVLPAGAHQLTFHPEENCQQSCAPVNFYNVALEKVDTLNSAPLNFDDTLTLIHYETSGTIVVPGQPLLVQLYWQGQTDADYGTFLHLADPSGDLIGQEDYLLGGWFYPTSKWSQEQITATPSLFFIPPDTPPGDYQVRVGTYNSKTGERLTVVGHKQDFVELITITVK